MMNEKMLITQFLSCKGGQRFLYRRQSADLSLQPETAKRKAQGFAPTIKNDKVYPINSKRENKGFLQNLCFPF